MKRQDSDDEEEDTQKKICAEAGAEAGEWFRLQAGKDKCRDVVSCTASVRYFVFFIYLFLRISLFIKYNVLIFKGIITTKILIFKEVNTL